MISVNKIKADFLLQMFRNQTAAATFARLVPVPSQPSLVLPLGDDVLEELVD